MPCASCGRVQTDPSPGRPSSPWVRAVQGGEQILLCPDCVAGDGSLLARLDRCPRCSSTRLYRVMGSLVCRECGADWIPEEGLESKPLG